MPRSADKSRLSVLHARDFSNTETGRVTRTRLIRLRDTFHCSGIFQVSFFFFKNRRAIRVVYHKRPYDCKRPGRVDASWLVSNTDNFVTISDRYRQINVTSQTNFASGSVTHSEFNEERRRGVHLGLSRTKSIRMKDGHSLNRSSSIKLICRARDLFKISK